MALFGLFGSDKPTPKNIEKMVARVKERYAQPEYRRDAMDTLLNWGTPEALDGVLSRFTVVVNSPHWDEEEKRWLTDVLVDLGAPAADAFRRFLAKQKDNVRFAVKALERIHGTGHRDALVEDLLVALKNHAPDDYRSAQAKTDLIASLEGFDDARINEALIPYLNDHADDVQCITIDVVHARSAEVAYEALATMVTDDLHSARVLRHAAGAVARLGLTVPGTVVDAVSEDFSVVDGKLVSNREG